MKKIFLILSIILIFSMIVNAQTLSNMPFLERYANSNQEIGDAKEGVKRVVFIGNSITEGWVGTHPDFFISNNYVGRGISGQTSPQLLLRFRQDVINLKPYAVIINTGTNDIAENMGTYNSTFTLDCIKSMAQLAEINGIKVILSSVLPVGEYSWKKEIKNVPVTIDALNSEIRAYANLRGYAYIDYNTPMRSEDGSMIEIYTHDGVHPTNDGYDVMEPLAKKVIDEVTK